MSSQKVYRLLIDELVSDQLNVTDIDLSKLYIRLYDVQAQQGEIYNIQELKNESDVWRQAERDLLVITYTDCKVLFYDIEQTDLLKTIDQVP